MKRQRIGRISRSIIRKEPPVVLVDPVVMTEAEALAAVSDEWRRLAIGGGFWVGEREPWYIRLWRRVTA